MEDELKTSSAERNTKLPGAEQQKNVTIENKLARALWYFKTGSKSAGGMVLDDALREAEQKGVSIPLETIEAIIDGRAPKQEQSSIVQENTVREALQPESPYLKQSIEDMKRRMMEAAQPVKEVIEKFIKEILNQIYAALNRKAPQEAPATAA